MYSDNSNGLKKVIIGENSSASESLTYKDVSILSKFINEQGKILPRRITGLTSREQKRITKLVKQARIAALFPFVIGKS
jgi:small subunit ribosomal protein S18